MNKTAISSNDTQTHFVAGSTLAGLIVALAVMFGLSGAYAGNMDPAPPPSQQSERASVLDGKIFIGEAGPVGKEAMTEDAWIFEEGRFRSRNCEECGFQESPYWVSFKQEGTQFLSETRCPVTDAKLIWKGTVKDGRIEGTYTWTRKRWYRTIEKIYWFRGKLVEDDRRGEILSALP